MTADAFVLTGTREPEPEPIQARRRRRSTADLVNGNLRTIRHDGIEVLRAIAYIVRDRDWGTYEPAISNLGSIRATDGFSRQLRRRLHRPGRRAAATFARGSTGTADGS